MAGQSELQVWEERAATLREKLADHSKLTGSDDPLRLMALEIVLIAIEQDIIPPLRESDTTDQEGGDG